MAEIKPFRGIRYAWEDLGADEMGNLVAPPYDVIGAEEQDALYAKHHANVVRLDLNRIKRNDNGEDNRYERARRLLFDWIAQGILVVDRQPTIYVHEQTFTDEMGTTYRRRGFISLVRLADYEEGVVLPHERTLKGPKKDRLELMKATECNLSQIFFLYDDPDTAVDEVLFAGVQQGVEASLDITTDDGIRHQLWALNDKEAHQAVAQQLADSPLLIADGHHRYETALAYRDFRRRIDEDPAEDSPYEYVMGFFVNIHDPGLQVFPTHRIVHSVEGFEFSKFTATLEASPHFSVTPIDEGTLADLVALRDELERAGADRTIFAVVAPGRGQGLWVRFEGDEDADFFIGDEPSKVRSLDVSVLHDGIFESLLGIDREAQRDMSHLRYAKSWEAAARALEEDETQLVAFMNPTPVEQVNQVCLSGGRMPQKSTYFYPKILSGLVINPL